MTTTQALLLVATLFTVGAVMYMIVSLAANDDVSGEKLVAVLGFAGMTMTVLGTIAGYVVGKMGKE